MNNLKEFKELILKYESITLSDIENSESYQNDMSKKNEVWFSNDIIKELTGYGSVATCTLCLAINMKKGFPESKDCVNCTWVKKTKNLCYKIDNAKTYKALHEALIESEDRLVEACHARAEYMRSVIDWYDKEIK